MASNDKPQRSEYKVTVFPREEDAVYAEVGRQGVQPKPRTVYFYDTPDLALASEHLLLRARVTGKDKRDSTVKLRPAPNSKPAKWREAGGDVRFERDVVGDRSVLSLKLDHTPDTGKLAKSPGDLFGAAQKRLVTVKWKDVRALGPIRARVWALEYETEPTEVSVEEWDLDGRVHFIELSFKVEAGQEGPAEQGFHALLDRLGIGHSGDRDPKTTRVLEYFAARL
jgi:hypothetical protein